MFSVKLVQVEKISSADSPVGAESLYMVVSCASYRKERVLAGIPEGSGSTDPAFYAPRWHTRINLMDSHWALDASYDIGDMEMWNKAYVMNLNGKTIDTIY